MFISVLDVSEDAPPPVPPKPTNLSNISQDPDDYEKMGPSGATSQVKAGKTKTKSKPKPLTDEEKVLTRPFNKYLPDPLLIYNVLL